ncbi:NTP transferase domain-containing protein [Azohydromonas sp. G-1-1-14]|uniref:NTP transferase domain-containing protein n=2 Tax=Azohydromonas caseinilytica TaxID=2728836 RepID=A0A848F4N6_9BURK|nr:NTP transferase domain-containing protein [Azohydromonas caseinilytica]
MTFCPTVIVLAAGRGSRFYGPQRAPRQLDDADMLEATLRQAVASELPVLVVTTPALEPSARSLVAARDVAVLPDVKLPDGSLATPGLSASIAAGVGARPDASGWVVLPADMPLVQPGTLVAVAQALRVHAVAYAQHAGRRGHPVGFAAELYSELVQLPDDSAARRLVARYPSCGVDVDDPGTQLDLESLQDLHALPLPPGPPALAPVPPLF